MDEELCERFEAKVDRSGGPEACHPWIGRKDRKGYGLFDVDGGEVRASRVVLVKKLGRPIASSKMALHTCDNPPCVNEAHLYEGTAKRNAEDAKARGRLATGDRNARTKLSEAAVLDIRSRTERVKVYVERYGVTRHHVRLVQRGKRRS